MKKCSILRIVLILLGILLLVDAAAVTVLCGLDAGVYAVALFGIVFCLYGIFLPRLKGARAMHLVMIALCAVLIVISGSLALYGHRDTVTYEEDVMIVLGAGLHNNEPTGTLEKRMDTAYAYYQKNPEVTLIVSGGLGNGKQMSEAQAMENYLIAKGVPADQIIREERSTDTKENFAYSMELIQQMGKSSENAAFITSGFHVFRAELCARKAGLNLHHMGASVPWYSVPTNYAREMMALVKHWITA